MIGSFLSILIIVGLLHFCFLYLYFTSHYFLNLLFFVHTVRLAKTNCFYLYLESKIMVYLHCFSRYNFDCFQIQIIHLIAYLLENLKLNLCLFNLLC